MDVSFTKHPREVGESYGEHFLVATRFGVSMIGGGLACLVHAVLPFCCTRTGSTTIERLNERMVVSRSRVAAAAGQPSARGTQGMRVTSIPSSASASACSGVDSP